MSTDRSFHVLQPETPSLAVSLLTRLATFQQWWLHNDLPNQFDSLMTDLCHLLAAEECVLYLEEHPAGMLALAARSEQASAPVLVQVALPTDAPWTQIREWWITQRFAEVSAACNRLLFASSGSTRSMIAPLFVPEPPAPLGFLVVRTAAEWTQEEVLLLSLVSTPLALRLAEQQARSQVEYQHLLASFVRLLCTTSLDPAQKETVRNQARFLGFDLSQPHLVVRARLAALQKEGTSPAPVLSHLKASIEPHFPGALLLLEEDADVFGLLPLLGTSEQALCQLKQIVRDLHPRLQVLLGVSAPSRTLPDYACGSAEARDALVYARHFHEGSVFPIQEVGPLRFLNLKEARCSRATDRYSQAIQRLAEYDQQYCADLVYTLEKFLLAGGRYSQTARLMGQEPGKAIASGTVRQRVERMCELTQLDLLDSTFWLHVQLAIQVHRLQEE